MAWCAVGIAEESRLRLAKLEETSAMLGAVGVYGGGASLGGLGGSLATGVCNPSREVVGREHDGGVGRPVVSSVWPGFGEIEIPLAFAVSILDWTGGG